MNIEGLYPMVRSTQVPLNLVIRVAQHVMALTI